MTHNAGWQVDGLDNPYGSKFMKFQHKKHEQASKPQYESFGKLGYEDLLMAYVKFHNANPVLNTSPLRVFAAPPNDVPTHFDER